MFFERTLAERDRLYSTQPPCATGYSPNVRLYIVNATDWAEQAGLHRGDRITAVGGAPVTGLEDYARALGKAPTGGPMLVTAIDAVTS